MTSVTIAQTTSALAPRRILTPNRQLELLSWVLIVGALLTFTSIVIPHFNHGYDRTFLAIGGAYLLIGLALLRIAQRIQVGEHVLHLCCAGASVGILALSWLSMRDLGGVQAVFLILLLGMSASMDSRMWSVALLAAQSAGYGFVLATAATPFQLDRFSQWLVVTMGLGVSLMYHRMVRHQLGAVAARDDMLQAEQELQRAAHAEHLERLNRELEHANELKSSFVAMASHELRTPLTAISGFATTMTDRWHDLADEDKYRFVTIIDDQAARLSRLVRDLLTLSRIEGGRLEAHVAPVVVRDVVERTVRDLGLEDVRLELEDGLQVLADVDYLQQILVNFLANAISYGSHPVTIRAASVRGWIELQVLDEGCGVPIEFVPQLFDRFARGHELRHGDSGTGLGLSIVEGLAQAHGGVAWYEPNRPSGSRFGVRLPEVRPQA